MLSTIRAKKISKNHLIYSLPSTIQSDHCVMHTVHNTPHTEHYTIHAAHFTLHTVHCTLHTAHCTLHTAHCTLHTAQLNKTRTKIAPKNYCRIPRRSCY